MTDLSKRKLFPALLFGVLLLISCRAVGGKTLSSTPVATLAATAAPPTPAQTGAAPAAPGATPTQAPPSPTVTQAPTPTATLEPAALLAGRMAALLASGDWPVAGLDAARAAQWEAFGRGDAGLPQPELDALQQFLDRWDLLHAAAGEDVTPDNATVLLLAEQRPAEDGQTQPLLYAAVGGEDRAGERQLFMIARDPKGSPLGLVAAPEIDGLTQRISADGLLVEYVDPTRERVLLRADARKLDPRNQADQIIKGRLDEIYRKNHAYVRAGVYPRYFFPVEGLDAGFYLLEESLTFQQILQMNEAFALFDRPNLEPLKTAFFGPGTSVLVVEQMDLAAGLTYSGTGVIELDRRDLFGNKYYLAEVLAHEGSHVLQGRMTDKGGCAQVLQREVGDHTIPADFLTWTAEQVINGVRDHTIGAYHVSMWVLSQVGVRGRDTDLLRQVIQTGQVNGMSVTPFCKE